MNNSVSSKIIESMRKHGDIKLVTVGKKRTYLVSETNYHTTKSFTKNLLDMEMRKNQSLMNKPVCFGLLILTLFLMGYFLS